MALQAASLVSSAFSIPKEGSLVFKDSSPYEFHSLSLSDHHVKADFSSSVLMCKASTLIREFNQRNVAIRAQTTATTSSVVNVSSPSGKKTLRKGSVVILGLATAKALAETGEWHCSPVCRYLQAIRQHLDVLVCSAAVYQPTAKEPTYTAEGFELSVGTNYLGHFLLSRLLLDDLNQSDYPSKRLIIVGSITGNTNTLAGNVPPKANLGDLRGLAGELNELNISSMIDGGDFDGAKVYKDSKVCKMLPFTPVALPQQACSGSTFRCSGCSSLHSRSSSPRDVSEEKPERDSLRQSVECQKNVGVPTYAMTDAYSLKETPCPIHRLQKFIITEDLET
ncbi:hypothetical protein Ddye_026922 [Dipteronia dyeriana]|uniref:Protochlorophyllide reductase n=1 Tax=Dipteronia dyeriana TaxID=168575 RepID=A0AAD9TN35_9ROSI|nr:hypothetical protein Ddye_026922 [Dipteronia dyeriana]